MKRLLLLCSFAMFSCSVTKSSVPAPGPAAEAPPVVTPEQDLPPIEDPGDSVIQWDEVEQAVLTDIQDKRLVSRADELNTVYLSAANFQNFGDDVNVAKQAGTLLINMLSNGSGIESVRPLKGMPSVFAVNITDFFDGGTVEANADWTQIENTAVLRIVSNTARGRNLQALTGKQIPIMHLQVFLETALLAQNYYAFKKIPVNEAEYYANKGINRQAAYDDRDSKTLLSGFAISLIAPGHNRTIERLDGDEGSCWKTFDIDSLQLGDPVFADAANFFKNPFPIEALSANSTFQFSASETICRQKNGFMEVALWSAAGVRQDVAPTTVVLNLRTSALGLEAEIKPRDCTGCHTSFILPFRDEIGRQIKNQPFAAQDKILGELFFKPQVAVDKAIADENSFHLEAMSRIGVQQGSADPINVGAIDKMRDGYTARELAAFLYLSEGDFISLLDGSQLAANEIGQLGNGGTLGFFALQGSLQTIIDDLQLFQDRD